MTLPESFSGYPVSVAEVRAERSQDCANYKPRDTLIAFLRDIDEGRINPDALVICFRETDEEGSATGFRNACPDILVAMGMMQRVAWRLNGGL